MDINTDNAPSIRLEAEDQLHEAMAALSSKKQTTAFKQKLSFQRTHIFGVCHEQARGCMLAEWMFIYINITSASPLTRLRKIFLLHDRSLHMDRQFSQSATTAYW